MDYLFLRHFGIVLLSMSGLIAGAAVAQNNPSRPIRMVVPYGTGGNADIIARLISPSMTAQLEQQVIVENRAGAAGIPGMMMVAKANPDGNTVLVAASNLAANPILFRKLPYDAEKDFAPVSMVATQPVLLVVHPAVPANSVKELIALAKAKPGQLNYGSVGNGSGSHLITEMFNNAAGIKVEQIAYKGTGAALTDLAGGQYTFMFSTIPGALPFISGGRLRILGVSSLKRTPTMPDVPTISESALPGFEAGLWLGILVPAKTPASTINRLNAVVVKSLDRAEVRDVLKSLGAEPIGSTPAQLGAHLKSELVRWVKLAQTVKFEVAD